MRATLLVLGLAFATGCPRSPEPFRAGPGAADPPPPTGPCAPTCQAACARSDLRGKAACAAVCMEALRRPGPTDPGSLCGVADVPRLQVVIALVKRAIADEAVRHLEEIFDRSVRYFRANRRFPPPAGPTPARLCSNPDGLHHPSPGLWDAPTWKALEFEIRRPFYFRYTYLSRGEGPGASFTIRAEADLDCNGVTAVFEKTGVVDDSGAVSGGDALYRSRERE